MQNTPPKASRRGVFISATAAGAAVATVSVIKAPGPETVPEVKPAPTRGGGYSLSDHVKRYYKTTLV